MTYIRALVASFLLHSFAFAGSYLFLNQSFTAQKMSSTQGAFLTVSLVNDTPDLNVSKAKKSQSINTLKNTTSSKPVRVLEAAALSASSMHTTDSNVQETFAQKDDGNGGANLIPHPENQAPIYPESARKEGLSGSMLLELTVNQKGLVECVEIKEGKDNPEILQKTAVDAVKMWRFLHKVLPKTLIKIQVPIVFDLDSV